MKKKKLLFTIPSLHAGGGEKSLVNLLSQIDYSQYEVDLFLFDKSGIFLNLLPKEVNIIDKGHTHEIFTKDLKTSTKLLICEKKFKLVHARIMFAIKNRIIKNKSIAEQYTWKYISKSINILDKQYDAAIGYLEKSSIYFVVDKVYADKKIGWIHTNYNNSGMDSKLDTPYFKKLDNLVTVSDECANALKVKFPDIKERISVIYNIVSPNLINKLSNVKLNNDFIIDDEYTDIITVARLSYEKGIDLAINTCKLLIDRGYKVRWYVLGDGKEKLKLEELIINNNLEDNFRLLGIKGNPYPYIKKADLYVQPSRYEGKSIAIDEAKILHKPIVVTNYESAKDQIHNNINGIIVEMNDEDLYEGIVDIIKTLQKREFLIENLKHEDLSTEEEIYKLYELVSS